MLGKDVYPATLRYIAVYITSYYLDTITFCFIFYYQLILVCLVRFLESIKVLEIMLFYLAIL